MDMTHEPLPFEDDAAGDAVAAFDGLRRALLRLREDAAPGSGVDDAVTAEIGFRVLDFLETAMDAAGLDDPLARMGAVNVVRSALADLVASIATDELGFEGGDAEGEGVDGEGLDEELAILLAARLGFDGFPDPLGLPALSFAGPIDPMLRN